MREEHLPFLVVGATVTAKATCFDEDIDNRWSQAVYGDAWDTAVVTGVVTRRRDRLVLVRFEDGDTIFMDPRDLELTGESLRTANENIRDLCRCEDPISGVLEQTEPGNDNRHEESEDRGSDDEPLLAMVRREHRAVHGLASPPPTSDSSWNGSVTSDEATPEPEAPPEGHGRGGRGRGRGRGGRRVNGRGRGRSRSAPDSGKEATVPTAMAGEVEIDDDGEDTETEEDSGDEGVEADNVLKMRDGQVWKKGVGRTVDPFLQKGYQHAARLRLPGSTEKNEMEYFLACFPRDLITEISELMTIKGRQLQFGLGWEVTPGEVYTFLGYNVAILLLHTGGPKQDMWLGQGDSKYDGAFFLAPDLGQYGLSYSRFQRLMQAFILPTYGNLNDPFDPIRKFVDHWNRNIANTLQPGPIIVVDESMGLWKGKGMPGLMVVARKPTPVGRESHTAADADTSCIIFVEPYEGKARMENKEWAREWGKAPATAMRCVKPWMGTGRLCIADAGFASMRLAKGMAEHGTFLIGNVKGAHTGFPKTWLLEQVPNRGLRASASTSFKTSSGETWVVVAAADRDKQPMTLIGTAGTTGMGEELVRHFTSIRSDGTFHVRSATLAQWDIHATYRKHFNAIDKHNSKCQGGAVLRNLGRPTSGGSETSTCFLEFRRLMPPCCGASLGLVDKINAWICSGGAWHIS